MKSNSQLDYGYEADIVFVRSDRLPLPSAFSQLVCFYRPTEMFLIISVIFLEFQSKTLVEAKQAKSPRRFMKSDVTSSGRGSGRSCYRRENKVSRWGMLTLSAFTGATLTSAVILQPGVKSNAPNDFRSCR